MTMLDTTAASLDVDGRAFVLLKSGRRLDLLDPDPDAWTDGDLAAGLSAPCDGVWLPDGRGPFRSPSTA